MDKESLRKRLKIARSALNKKSILYKSRILSSKILMFTKKNRNIASYCPFNNEINPNIYLEKKDTYFPKIKNGRMIFKNGSYGFLKGYGGIREPFGSRATRIFKRSIKTVIVPALAFDLRGYRIGYGMGFYDKFLESFRGLKIGVVYDCCIVEKINNESHDIPMDIILTETKNIRCKLRR